MTDTAIFLMGPTASGKTALAIALFQHLPIELISVDATQVYQDLTIGSGKPDRETLAAAPHHLIDILPPDQAYSAAQFVSDAQNLIREINQKGKIPLLVGGSMLYFHALETGLHALPDADLDIRAALEQEAQTLGWDHLYQTLEAVDPLTAARFKPNDKQRIQRALEIYRISGKPLSYWLETERQRPNYALLKFALIPKETPRSVLHEQINQRFDQMISAGLVEEVVYLKQKYALSESCPSMRAAGYRQVWHYLEQRISCEEMIEKAKSATRQLAKRQLTWLRSWPDLLSLDFKSDGLEETVVCEIERRIHQTRQ